MADALAKISGTLQEMSGEELARQQGLPAAPPTPLGAQGIGASQDVSKMAGTPNQIRGMVQGTLKERLRTKDLMQESERNGARGRFTVESLQEKMNVLEGLGSLDGRIQTALQTKISGAANVAVPNPVNKAAVTAHLSSLGLTDQASIDAALAALDKIKKMDASPADITAALDALKLGGTITDSTTSLADKFGKFFTQADVGTIKTQMATILKNFSEIKMKDLLDTTAGFSNQYNNIEDVPEILGIDDVDFGKMTFGEVQAQLKAWKNRNFQDVDALRDVLQDPTYSMAEKDYARQRLAELGAIGVTSIEQKANNLEAQVAEGDTVIVGGEVVKVSELMSDPKLKGVIATALESDEELTKLSGIDKGLADWITRNKAALVPIRNELLAGAEGFAKTNKEFVDKFGDDAAVYSKLLDSVIPGWNKAKGKEITLPDGTKTSESWATWLDEVKKTAPTFAAVLNELPSAARSVKFKILESMPADKAKSFSTAHLSAIASAANGDVTQAQVLTKAWLDSDTVGKAVLDFELPVVDVDFTDKDSLAIQTQIIKDLGKGYTQTTFNDYIKEMQRLSAGTPDERLKAQEMYVGLAALTSGAKAQLGPEAMAKFKLNKQVERATNDATNAVSPVRDSIKNVLQAIKGRGAKEWLNVRGTERLLPMVSELATLQTDLTLTLAKKLTPEVLKKELENFQNKVKEIKGRAAGELAAFVLDKPEPGKSGGTKPGTALDAAEQIMAAGFIDSLSAAQKQSIRERLEADMHMELRDKNHLSSPQKLATILRAFGSNKLVSYTG
jgi:hypothetical protein